MTGSRSRRARDRGSSAVEFGLVVAAMAAMILAVVFGVGRVVGSALQPACDGLAAHTTPQGVCVSDPRSQPATGS